MLRPPALTPLHPPPSTEHPEVLCLWYTEGILEKLHRLVPPLPVPTFPARYATGCFDARRNETDTYLTPTSLDTSLARSAFGRAPESTTSGATGKGATFCRKRRALPTFSTPLSHTSNEFSMLGRWRIIEQGKVFFQAWNSKRKRKRRRGGSTCGDLTQSRTHQVMSHHSLQAHGPQIPST
ncbi:hypothetical protein BC834DRAFT_237751 [Gloeopeniophorella convolvens]|nr:hypothetical protein BC834DRAFT_237751 [Gloeopeniophorella convolvens]